MDGRNPRMDAAHVVRTLHSEGHARTAEQAVRIVKLVARAVAELQALGIDERVRGLDLGLDIEEARDVEAPAELAREAQRHVVHRTLLAAVNRHVGLGGGKTTHHVHELAGLTHPQAVGRKTIEVHVGIAAPVVGFAARVAQCRAEADRAVAGHGVDTRLNRVEVVLKPCGAREATAVITRPDARRALGRPDVAEALPHVVHENAVDRKRRGRGELKRGLHDGVRPRARRGTFLVDPEAVVVHAFLDGARDADVLGCLNTRRHERLRLFRRQVVGGEVSLHLRVLELDVDLRVFRGFSDGDRAGLASILSRQIRGKIDRAARTGHLLDRHVDGAVRDVDHAVIVLEKVEGRVFLAESHGRRIFRCFDGCPRRAFAQAQLHARDREILVFRGWCAPPGDDRVARPA